ncbi:MAG: MFS transporter [Bacteroidetes bacterium]|nr:MFS transporter [Bacteroidota bacterium]
MSFVKTQSLHIFKIKEFRWFVLSRFFMTLGVRMQFMTISLQVYDEYAKSEFMLGMIGLTEAVPFIIASFYSGHVADRFPKKRILDFGLFFLLLGATFLCLNSWSSVLLFKNIDGLFLFIIVFLFGIFRAFLAATANPYLSQLVPRNMYLPAATWNSTAWHTGDIVGPVLGGILYGIYGAELCHFTEMIFFSFAFFFMLQIKHKGLPQEQPKKESVFESMKTGLKFVFKTKMLLGVISLDLFAVLFGGAVAIIPAFVDKVLGLGPEAVGLLRTAPAFGAVVCALIMAIYPPSKKAGVTMLWSVIAFGVFTILFGISTNYWLAFAMLFMTGAFDNVSVVVRHSILQLMTPDNMRGRVSAINGIFIGSSNEIGAFESGVAARLLGLVPSIAFGGVMTILTVLGVVKINPELKKLDISKLE